MKKLLTGIVALALTGQMAIGQGVSDMEVIPVSVTVNTILRINVVKGGNIEFVLNTIADYKDGIANTERYDTRFTVAASRDFDVNLVNDGDLAATDNNTTQATLDASNVGYQMTETGIYADPANFVLPVGMQTLISGGGANTIIMGVDNAGDVQDNDFTINWELQTAAVDAISGIGTLLSQNIAGDRYTTNVFLELEELP